MKNLHFNIWSPFAQLLNLTHNTKCSTRTKQAWTQPQGVRKSERLTSINKLVKITSICRAQLCEYHYIARSCLNASLCICSDTFGKTTFYWFWNAFLYHWRDEISKCQMWTQNESAFVVNSPATAYRQQRLYIFCMTSSSPEVERAQRAKSVQSRQIKDNRMAHTKYILHLCFAWDENKHTY